MDYSTTTRNGLVDEFITPTLVAESVVNKVVPAGLMETSDCIYALDPGANKGAWGRALRIRWPFVHITGVELMTMPELPSWYDVYIDGTDYLDWEPDISYDLILGNPPYSDYRTGIRQTVVNTWVLRSLNNLRDGGYLVFLLRHGFTHGLGRHADIFKENPFKEVWFLLPRPNFYDKDDRADGDGARYEYSVFVWEKGWKGTPTCHWLDWR